MIIQVISGLAILTISALFFLAFYHPEGYEKIYWVILVIDGFVYTWMNGYNAAIYRITEKASELNIEAEAVKSFEVLSEKHVNLICISILMFAILLIFVKNLNDKNKK